MSKVKQSIEDDRILKENEIAASEPQEIHEYELHIPTEQYGFILKRITGSDSDAASAYRSLQNMLRAGDGITEREFNDFLDSYLQGNLDGRLDEYTRMNQFQQDIVQIIKRSLKRIKAKNNK